MWLLVLAVRVSANVWVTSVDLWKPGAFPVASHFTSLMKMKVGGDI